MRCISMRRVGRQKNAISARTAPRSDWLLRVPSCARQKPSFPVTSTDPGSSVAQLKSKGELVARKVEAGTGPNVHYVDVAASGVDPLKTQASGGYLWSQQRETPQQDVDLFRAMENRAEARTVLRRRSQNLTGVSKITLYLFAKSIAGGLGVLAPPLLWMTNSRAGLVGIMSLALVALTFDALLPRHGSQETQPVSSTS